MKKLIFMGVLGLFLLGSCNSKSGHDHEGHDHGTEEAHNHDHEEHDHNHEGHDHEKKTTTMRMKVTKGIIMKRKLLQPDIPMR